jgi:hypothetical protein
VEAILVRWQYSGLDWRPAGGAGVASSSSASAASASASASSSVPADVPTGFMAMNGFPGVYVGVTEEVLGVIRDTRPLAPRPSYVSGAGYGSFACFPPCPHCSASMRAVLRRAH